MILLDKGIRAYILPSLPLIRDRGLPRVGFEREAEMIVDLRSITYEPRQFHFMMEEEALLRTEREAHQILGLEGPLDVFVTLYKAGDKFVLEGRVGGRIRSCCDRCLEEYVRELKGDFRLFLGLPPEGADREEMELSGEDVALEFVTGDEIDLGEIAREQVFLALPMRSLCKDSCAGLCPVCGTDLNRQTCMCRRTPAHPGFTKLKDFNPKGEKA
jgi:uncharacterized protein